MISGGLTRLLWAYHFDVRATVEDYRDHARRYRKIHNWFQTAIIIIGSLTTTTLTTAAANHSPVETAAVCVGVGVGASAGMTGYFTFRERSMNLQQATNELELEYKAAELGIYACRSLEEEDRLVGFAQRAGTIKEQQREREQQLERPPEAGSALANTSNTHS